MKHYIIILLLFAGSVFGGDYVVDTTIKTLHSAAYINPLGCPRSHLVCFSDSGHIAFKLGGGLMLSYNNGTSTVDENALNNGNHTHLNISDNIIYAGMSTVAGGGAPIIMVYSDSGSANDYLHTIIYDTVTSPEITTTGVFPVQKVPGTNYICGLVHNDQAYPATNTSFILSNDTGATWTDPVLIVDVPDVYARVGLFINTTTLYAVFHWSDSVKWYSFNTADTTWSYEGGITGNNLARDYSYTGYNDTMLFCAAQSEPALDDSLWLFWGYKHVDSTNFISDSFYVGASNTGSGETMLGTTLTELKASGFIFLTYLKYENDVVDTDDSLMLYGRVFDWDSMGWVNETRLCRGYGISSGATQTQSAPYAVPSSFGDEAFIVYDAVQYGGDQDYMLTIVSVTDTGTTPTADTLYTDTVTLTIDSLPYTCTTNRTLIKFSGDLAFEGIAGIIINADTVRISGNGWGDTLTFNSLKHSGQERDGDYKDIDSAFLRIEPGCNIIVDSLVIIESTNEGDSLLALNAVGTSGSHLTGLILRECRIHVKSNDAGNISLTGIDNAQIIGGNYTSFVDSFLRRDSDVMRSMYIEGYPNDSVLQEGEYTCRITGVVIDSCPHTGIGLLRGLFQVESCYVWVNQHNLRYLTPDGAYHSANNAYGIGCTALMGGTYIRECSLQVRDSYQGGRGFYFDYNDPVIGDMADTTNPIIISNNYVDVRTGPDVEYPNDSGTTWGFRVRYRVRGMEICSNYVKITLDNDPATANIGGDGAGIYINSDDTNTVDNQNMFKIYNNTVIAYADSTTFVNGTFSVDAFNFVDTLDITPGSRSWNNRFISNMCAFKLGMPGSYWGEDFTSIGDTFEWYDNRFTDFYSFQGIIGVGNTGNDAPDNKFYDPVFINADDSDITYGTTNGVVEAELYVTCTVLVIDSNSTPINGATVYMIDVSGDTISTLTTNANGLVIDTIMYWDIVWSDASLIDTTYNDFTVSGVYDAVSADSTIEFRWDNKSTTVQLGAESGSVVVRYRLKGVKR